MSLLEWRGGFPVAHGGVVTTAGVFTPDRGGVHAFATAGYALGVNMLHWDHLDRKPSGLTSKWLEVRNTGVNPLRVYFSQSSFDDDADYVELLAPAAASDGQSVWYGPYEAEQFWAKGVGGNAIFRIIAANRRN